MTTYNSPSNITPLTRARSANVNDVDDACGTSFALIPDETLMKQGKVTYAADTGTADTCLISLAVSPASYADGLEITFKPAVTNTGATTINVNSLGVKSIRNIDSTALVAGALVAGAPAKIVYSTTSGFFHLLSSAAFQAASGSYATLNGIETLANKTLTSPTINGATLTGTITGGALAPTSISTTSGSPTFGASWTGTNSSLVRTPDGIVHLRLFLTTTGSPSVLGVATLPSGFRGPAGFSIVVPAFYRDSGTADISCFAFINPSTGVVDMVAGATALPVPASGDQIIVVCSFNTV